MTATSMQREKGMPGVLDLSREDFCLVDEILAAWVPGRPVFIFGSRVTGSARYRSDLDLAIGGDGCLPFTTTVELKEAFSTSDLPIFVDIVDLAEVTEVFRQRIESEWIPFHVAAQQLAAKAVA